MKNVTICFPNEGAYTLSEEVISQWKIDEVKTIGDTNFCKSEGSYFSINIEDYNNIFKK
jgi:hypothetical protein